MGPVRQYDTVLHGQRVTVKVYRSPTYDSCAYWRRVRHTTHHSFFKVDDTWLEEPAKGKQTCGRPRTPYRGED